MSTPNIIEAVADPAIFAPHFRERETWQPWWTAVRAIFGLPMSADELPVFRECTGREEAPAERASEAWLVVGRRGGKSRVLALIASYLAAFVDWSPYLSPGERGYLVIVAADRRQCRTIMGYCRAFLANTPLLADLIERDTTEELELSNGLTIEVATSSYRTIRGRTIIAALCDEAAFWADENGANPASEVIASLRPAMATIPGAMLLVASSPYAKRGPLWNAFKKYFGKVGRVLVWKAPTRTMNPTIAQEILDEAYEADPLSAAGEYGAEFRNDIDAFVTREAVDGAVIPNRRELMRETGVRYVAFVDPSGGSSDSMTLAIAHMHDNRSILDVVREWRPPFSPDAVVVECAALLKSFGIGTVTGDRYAGEWPRERFKVHGITYLPSEQTKSELYVSLLPLLNSERAELLDLPRLVAQLCALERRTSRAGRDSIDHAPGSHDDIANSVAGALVMAAGKKAPMVISDVLLARAAQPSSYWHPDRYMPH
ncbi:MAG: hypothetical protein ACREHV_00650 [Rhizomicrobium sp.]